MGEAGRPCQRARETRLVFLAISMCDAVERERPQHHQRGMHSWDGIRISKAEYTVEYAGYSREFIILLQLRRLCEDILLLLLCKTSHSPAPAGIILLFLTTGEPAHIIFIPFPVKCIKITFCNSASYIFFLRGKLFP